MQVGTTPIHRRPWAKPQRLVSALLGFGATAALILATAPGLASDTPREQAIRLGDEVIVTLTEPRGDVEAAVRARSAIEALEALAREPRGDLEVVVRGDALTILSGNSPVLELGEPDRIAAHKPDLMTLGKEVAQRMRAALERERRRAAIARRVLGLSSVVFLGLMAILLLRAVARWSRRVAHWIDAEAESRGGVRVRSLELLSPSTTRESLRAFSQVVLWSTRVGIVFGWSMMTLSLFDSTRGLAQRATGKLFLPGLAFLERLATQVPVLLATTVALVIVGIAVRFTLAYFAAIERGELESDWARPGTAYVTGRVIAGAIILGSCLFIAPLVSGSENGILPRVGVLGIGTLALASTPLWASCALGLRLVYGGAIRLGEVVSYGGVQGRVEQIGLFDLVLDDEGMSVRVPHLMSLWHPTRVWRQKPHQESAPGTDKEMAPLEPNDSSGRGGQT